MRSRLGPYYGYPVEQSIGGPGRGRSRAIASAAVSDTLLQSWTLGLSNRKQLPHAYPRPHRLRSGLLPHQN